MWGSEIRSYNAMLQLTSLSSSGVSVTYNYSATQNNGKIISQQGPVSGETITYAYDSLNRLATATSSGATPLWGQSYAYDGFGNLTDITTTQGSTPEWHQSYSAATNRAGTDVAYANRNIGSGCQLSSGCYNYDVENRIISSAPMTTVQYAYAPDNKRVWRSDWSNGSRTVDEVTFWSVTGQRVATFNLVSYQASLRPVQTATEYYFGGKLIKNGTGYVYSDRLGSIGKFYPYGQERPSATTNGTEKFATYFRDSETGLDYADQRYHAPGQGRFCRPTPIRLAEVRAIRGVGIGMRIRGGIPLIGLIQAVAMTAMWRAQYPVTAKCMVVWIQEVVTPIIALRILMLVLLDKAPLPVRVEALIPGLRKSRGCRIC